MRIFVTKWFARYARRQSIVSEALIDAIDRADRGLIDADLGGNVIKQRVARKRQGRSGGFRTVIAFRTMHRSVFIFGFAKNDLDNIGDVELAKLRSLARYYLQLSDGQLEDALLLGDLVEVDDD